MKHLFFVGICIVVGLTSCTTQRGISDAGAILKRKHLKGYHLSWQKTKQNETVFNATVPKEKRTEKLVLHTTPEKNTQPLLTKNKIQISSGDFESVSRKSEKTVVMSQLERIEKKGKYAIIGEGIANIGQKGRVQMVNATDTKDESSDFQSMLWAFAGLTALAGAGLTYFSLLFYGFTAGFWIALGVFIPSAIIASIMALFNAKKAKNAGVATAKSKSFGNVAGLLTLIVSGIELLITLFIGFIVLLLEYG